MQDTYLKDPQNPRKWPKDPKFFILDPIFEIKMRTSYAPLHTLIIHPPPRKTLFISKKRLILRYFLYFSCIFHRLYLKNCARS